MDKTLGQIAYESIFSDNDELFVPWNRCCPDSRSSWEIVAAAVAAAVKEEDAAMIDIPGRHSGHAFATAIRASIKEVKS